MADRNASSEGMAGQVAVVTGATRGIGAAIAERLAAMDITVVLTGRNHAGLQQILERIERGGGQATVQACDLGDPASVDDLRAAVERLGRCDILVNCAGVGYFGQPLHVMDVASFDEVIDTNLRGPFLMIRTLAPLMIAARRGHIINISSLAGKNPLPNGAAYAASKWGLNGLSYSAAEELRPHNIRVSLIAPGSVNTHFGGSGTEGAIEDQARAARKIQPTDIADIVALLVTQSPQSFISEVLVRPTTKP